jgi:hypothetical protein
VSCLVPKFSLAWLAILCALSAAHADSPGREYTRTATTADLVDESSLAFFGGVIDADTPIEWQLYVPASYDPGRPVGLMVYVSPTSSGRIPPGWKPVMAEKNLIWIAANKSGNRIASVRRGSFALLATVLAKREYAIDRNRIYISGLSGGGRIASVVAPQYAQLFKGAVYNCGVNFWGDETPKLMEQVKANRYVFVTGSKDFNRRETRKIFGAYRKAGVENIKLLDIEHMSHSNPDALNFAAAIDYLDSPP